MGTYTRNTAVANKASRSAADNNTSNTSGKTYLVTDNRPIAISQKKLQEAANNSSRVMQLKVLQQAADAAGNHSIQTKGKGIIQRQVIQAEDGTFYSHLNPKKFFATPEQAAEHEASLSPRYTLLGGVAPTLHTFISKNPDEQIANKGMQQSPKALGFGAIKRGMQQTKLKQETMQVFSDKVLTPGDWHETVVNKKGDDAFTENTDQSEKLLNTYEVFHRLYQETFNLIKAGDTDTARKNIEQLVQLQPIISIGGKKAGAGNKKKTGGGNDIIEGALNTGAALKDLSPGGEPVAGRRLLVDHDFDPVDQGMDDEPPMDGNIN